MILDLEPQLYGHFVGQWLAMMIEENRGAELSVWQNAAHRAVKCRKAIYDAEQPTEHAIVFAAIKKAALECAGMPHQKMVREFMDKYEGKTITSRTAKTYMNTLGFSWILGINEWKDLWLPKRPKGWN